MEFGFLYIAYGEKYRQEARQSVQSLLSHMPKARITVVTNASCTIPGCEKIIVKPMEASSYIDKIKWMGESPYSKTLFLDTDTYIAGSLDKVFGLLDYFDICMATELARPHLKKAPEGFEEHKEFNTGVILFNKNERVRRLFAEWKKIYGERRSIDSHDQPSMAMALALTDVKFGVLPNEYNIRAVLPEILSREVKIIHARVRNYGKILKELNRYSGNLPFVDACRNWLPASQKCVPVYGSFFQKWVRNVKWSFRPLTRRIRNKMRWQGNLILPEKGRFEK